MLVTTTARIEGYEITAYHGVVFGEMIAGINFVRDLAAGLTNFFGGRSGAYEEELIQARATALNEMEQRAQAMGANAVVGVSMGAEALGGDGNMLMLTVMGTAVTIRPRESGMEESAWS